MNIFKITLEKNDGTIYYVDNVNDIVSIIKSLPKIKFKKTGSLNALHKKYFGMVEELRKNTDAINNFSKLEFYNSVKPLLFKYLMDYKHCFTTNIPECSTKNLNIEGYSLLIEQLKVIAYDIYCYTFKT